jgi:hypothetical protein
MFSALAFKVSLYILAYSCNIFNYEIMKIIKNIYV